MGKPNAGQPVSEQRGGGGGMSVGMGQFMPQTSEQWKMGECSRIIWQERRKH